MTIAKLNLGGASLSTPAAQVVAVNPDDTKDLPRPVKSLWANTSGSVRGVPVENDAPVTVTVVGGSPVPIAFKRILATGTTAEVLGIVA